MSYTSAAEKHLSLHDSRLARIIQLNGSCTLSPHTGYYEELVSSIIGQQLSAKAASTIWNRFLALYGGVMPTPEQIIHADPEVLRSIGCSYAKVRYIQDLAHHLYDGRLDLAHISTLPNDQVIAHLTAVKGIGIWSAHMFLIFCLARLDVLPWGDLGIRKAAKELYGLPELPDRAALEQLSAQRGWKPFESVAAWYLWRSLDNI